MKHLADAVKVPASPGYRADRFAENYRLEHDLPFSMVPHLAIAWLMGQQTERLEREAAG